MKNVKTLFHLFLSSMLCLAFLFLSTHLSAQEDGPLYEMETEEVEPIALEKPLEVECLDSTYFTVTIGHLCSSTGITADSAKIEYENQRLNPALALKAVCIIPDDCDPDDTCEMYIKKFFEGTSLPTPDPASGNCPPGSFFFKKVTLKIRVACYGCTSSLTDDSPAFWESSNGEKSDQTLVEKLEVHPNPASNYVDLVVHSKEQLASSEVVIHDLTGKVVLSGELGFIDVGQTKMKLDVGTLESGIYFVTLLNESNQLESTKLVINR